MKQSGVVLNVRCQHCIFFKREETYGKPCLELGKIESSLPCTRFTPDPYLLEFTDKDISLSTVIKAIGKIEAKSLPILSALIAHEMRNRKLGFYTGQRVYIKVWAGEFLDSYESATVISATQTYVYVRGTAGFRGMFLHSSVMNEIEWEVKSKQLIKAKKLTNPDRPKNTVKSTKVKGVKIISEVTPYLKRTTPKKKIINKPDENTKVVYKMR
jgi:hypothetical protein